MEPDIIDLDDMMHAAICCPVLKQNGSPSSVIENQVLRKLKGFLNCRSGCYDFGNWLSQAFIVQCSRLTVRDNWWYSCDAVYLNIWNASELIADFHWFEFPNCVKNIDIYKLASSSWSVAEKLTEK